MANKTAKPSKNGTEKKKAVNQMPLVNHLKAEIEEHLEELEERNYENFSELQTLLKGRKQKKALQKLQKDAMQLEGFLGSNERRVEKLSERAEEAISEEEWKSIISECEHIQSGLDCLKEDYSSFQEELEEVKERIN